MMSDDRIVTLNVGGMTFATKVSTLIKEDNTLFDEYFGKFRENLIVAEDGQREAGILPHGNDQYFIDRDGELFRHVLNYLRLGTLMLPEDFRETNQLLQEAYFFKIGSLVELLQSLKQRKIATSDQNSWLTGEHFQLKGGHITISYRGTFIFGRSSHVEVKFRKICRLLVCGKAELCKEVFSDTLNESRDPDRVAEKSYTSRMYLKHNSLEMAFDTLYRCGFRLIASCGSGASTGFTYPIHNDSEEHKWNHYNEFVFFRPGGIEP